tara:strand:- start:30 stop:863 length:834 start_codon:yes stop_codon:yes gene_type:complete
MQLIKRLPLIFVLLIVGCSTTTFIYNRIDFLLPWYLGKYVELTRDQKQYLDELLIPFFNWHRSDELPKYLEIINHTENILEGEVKPENIAAISINVEESWFRLEKKVLVWMLPLASDLTDEQIQSFLQVMQKKAKEYENTYLGRGEKDYRQDAYDKIRDNLQRFMGELSQQQLSLVRSYTADMQRRDGVWLQNRKALLVNLSSILERNSGWKDRLTRINQRDSAVQQSYRETYVHNLDVIYHLLAEVLNNRSEKQNQRLRQQLLKYRTDIETLINNE